MSEFTLAHEHHNMVPAPAASAVVQVIFKTEGGIILCYGTSAVSVLQNESANTYVPGCIYIKVVAGGTSIVFVNTGAADAAATFTSLM